MKRQVTTRNTNDYEMSRMTRIQENQERLKALGVQNIAKSLTSLVQSDNPKKKKKKPTDTGEKDADYMSGSDFHVNAEEDNPQEAATQKNTKVRIKNLAIILSLCLFSNNSTCMKQHRKYIAPQSMTRYTNLAKK